MATVWWNVKNGLPPGSELSRLLRAIGSNSRTSTEINLPKSITAAYFTEPLQLLDFHKEPLKTTDHTLVELKPNDDTTEAYVLEYKKAGTLIIDRTTPEARERRGHLVRYTVAADWYFIAQRKRLRGSRNETRTFCPLVSDCQYCHLGRTYRFPFSPPPRLTMTRSRPFLLSVALLLLSQAWSFPRSPPRRSWCKH